MKDENNSYLGFALFSLFIVFIVLAGSIILYFDKNEKRVTLPSDDKVIEISDKKKQEKEKDFIYFTDIVTLDAKANLIYKLPIINLQGTKISDINEEIKNYVADVKKSAERIETPLESCPDASVGDIKVAHSLSYAIYNYDKYSTLFMEESAYSCESVTSDTLSLKSYTFNNITGEYLSMEQLLKLNHLTYTEVLDKIKAELTLNASHEGSTILVDATLNELKANRSYVIYLTEEGSLIVKYIVKTTSVDYNDIIVLN